MGSRIFFKYRPANENTIALLEKQELKFSCAGEYNDPFDSKLILNVDSSIESILQHLERTPIDESTRELLRTRIRNGEITRDEHSRAAYEAAEHTIMSCCLSGISPDTSKSLLLWSHYADSHKGVCIGLRDCSSTDIAALKFNVEDSCSALGSPLADGLFLVYKVIYSESGIVEWKPFDQDIQIFIDAHRHKAKCWEYEDEYRLIVPRGEFRSQILHFDPRFLVEVYLGCRIDDAYRNWVRGVLRVYIDRGIEVKLFQMTRSRKQFALEKEELKV